MAVLGYWNLLKENGTALNVLSRERDGNLTHDETHNYLVTLNMELSPM